MTYQGHHIREERREEDLTGDRNFPRRFGDDLSPSSYGESKADEEREERGRNSQEGLFLSTMSPTVMSKTGQEESAEDSRDQSPGSDGRTPYSEGTENLDEDGVSEISEFHTL